MAIIPAILTTYIYFASGSNRSGDIRGFHWANIDLGVAAPEILSKRDGVILDAETELYDLAGTGRRVFVDSGAFSEVDFPGGVPTVVDPITHEEWERRLDLYERLAERLGSQLFVVAPDQVAFQWATLDRLDTYGERVRRLRDLGANIIVPHQKGSLSLVEFNAYAADFLGFDDFICGFPMQKDATEIGEIGEFCAAVRPARVHLLGIGPRSKGTSFGEAIDAIEDASPTTEIFCDSVALRGVAGRTGGKGNGPRRFTLTADDVAVDAAVEAWREGVDGVGDYTDSVIEDIDAWMPKSTAKGSPRRRLVEELEAIVGTAPRGAAKNLRGWLQDKDDDGDCIADNPWVDEIIDGFWAKYAHDASATWRKAETIHRHFGGTQGADLR